ncbi:uncharacterized protein LOC135842637 isoform X2 [Planococcus citri]|uniref:uncharacterized protein LOC135842637 isoform X2 n=1 Tax=Planococcus citri TaxID=170843 RepID=UPI0031F7CF2B
MYLLILAPLCFQFITEARSEKALIFNVIGGQLDSTEFTQCGLTACAPFTEKEKQFNEKISLSGNSVFGRAFPGAGKTPSRVEKDVCENPFQPAVVYDAKNNTYLIGYELYYKSGKIRLECDFYNSLKPVDQKNYTISSKPKDNSLAAKYQEADNTKFCFYNDPSVLVFYWITVLSINFTGHDKKWIPFNRDQYNYMRKHDHPTGECKDYLVDEEIESIFSEQNQAEVLKDIPSLRSLPVSDSEMTCGQSYGCLDKWQIIPLWHFHTSSAKLASCAAINIVPVWRSILNEQLKKVDRYIHSVVKHFRQERYRSKHEVNMIFGVSEIMKYNYENGANDGQEIHLTNTEQTRTMAIPEIIYRIVQYRLPKDFDYLGHPEWFTAAVIVHNNLNPANFQRLCTPESELNGWDKIKNEDPKTGITYVCPVTKEIGERLGVLSNLTSNELPPLHLDKVPTIGKKYYVSFEDNRDGILNQFGRVVEK